MSVVQRAETIIKLVLEDQDNISSPSAVLDEKLRECKLIVKLEGLLGGGKTINLESFLRRAMAGG